MASSALKGQSRRINVKRVRSLFYEVHYYHFSHIIIPQISSLESILEEGASLRQTSSILTLSAIVLQAVSACYRNGPSVIDYSSAVYWCRSRWNWALDSI